MSSRRESTVEGLSHFLCCKVSGLTNILYTSEQCPVAASGFSDTRTQPMTLSTQANQRKLEVTVVTPMSVSTRYVGIIYATL